MKAAILIALGILSGVSTASAQTTPLTKRAVVVAGSPIQAKASAERITTSFVEKEFFVVYGGQVQVEWLMRGDGVNTVETRVFFDKEQGCLASTESATYQGFGCGNEVSAGGHVRIVFTTSGGHEGAIAAVKLYFSLVDVNQPAINLLN